MKAAGVKNVGILPDNDDPGLEHTTKIAGDLFKKFNVKIIELPGLGERLEKHGKDVSDWLDAGRTAEKLAKLAEAAPLILTKPEPPPEAEKKKPYILLSMGKNGPHNNINNALRILKEAPEFTDAIWFDEFYSP